MKNGYIRRDEAAESANVVYGRQIAFVAAFLLPTAKLLEVPSLLAKYAANDLLLPALLHFLLQGALLFALLYAAAGSERTLFERLEEKLGKGARAIYAFLAVYYVFAAWLPLLDLEKYVYAIFFDTAPTSFTFAIFFVLSGYISMQSLKTVGRSADFCLFLFPISFLALLGMALTATDFSRLLPLFGVKFSHSATAFTRSAPQFADVLFLLPLVGNYRHKKGDTPKIMAGYAVGAGFTLLFLAVFFGVFSSIAAREHYAFSKIARYFPALKVTGRVDLIFIYALTVVLLLYTCFLLLYTVEFVRRAFSLRRKLPTVCVLHVGLFFFVLFCNRRYNAFYETIGGKLFWIFPLVSTMVLAFLLLPKKTKPDGEGKTHV